VLQSTKEAHELLRTPSMRSSENGSFTHSHGKYRQQGRVGPGETNENEQLGKGEGAAQKVDPPTITIASADDSTMNVTGKPNSSLIHRRLLGCFAGLGVRKDKIVGTTAEPRNSSRPTLAGDSENRLRADGDGVNFLELRHCEVLRIPLPRTSVNSARTRSVHRRDVSHVIEVEADYPGPEKA
jgi:hypothetical protein